MINNSKADIVEIFIRQPKCTVQLVISSRKISMTRSMHLQTCRILTMKCINGMVTPIHCNNNRPRRHDCRSDVRIFSKRTVVYDLYDRNLYLPFPPVSLSLTHTYTSQHRWKIQPSRQTLKI